MRPGHRPRSHDHVPTTSSRRPSLGPAPPHRVEALVSRRHHGRPRQQTPGVEGARPAPQATVGPPRPNQGGRPPQRTDSQRHDATPVAAPIAPDGAPLPGVPAGAAPATIVPLNAMPTNAVAHEGALHNGAPLNGHDTPSGQPGHGQPIPTRTATPSARRHSCAASSRVARTCRCMSCAGASGSMVAMTTSRRSASTRRRASTSGCRAARARSSGSCSEPVTLATGHRLRPGQGAN